MKAIVTVLGHDRVGIISEISKELAALDVNIEDISQTLMQNYFVMIMMTDVSKSSQTIAQINSRLKAVGEKIGLDVRVQHEDIFNCMHRI
ncbi:MAG: ACT domain-containing protein [Clostridia bacterium]|jgi:ACT domain-containing protein|nr:ACT domain-containing protein [Clostridia bacterium]